jgi:hypothetical protein
MYAEFVSSKDERRSDEVTLVASFAMNGRSGRPQARV